VAIIISGFEIIVEPGDVFSGLTAGNGAPYFAIYVSSGGTIIDTEIFNGGIVNVLPGDMAISTIFSQLGGLEVVFGAAIGAQINSATLVIASGGFTGSGPIVFLSGGKLALKASVNFGGTISGFHPGNFLDLADIAFGSNTTLGFSEAPQQHQRHADGHRRRPHRQHHAARPVHGELHHGERWTPRHHRHRGVTVGGAGRNQRGHACRTTLVTAAGRRQDQGGSR